MYGKLDELNGEMDRVDEMKNDLKIQSWIDELKEA